jgi:hypothetical protein
VTSAGTVVTTRAR